MKRSKKYKAAAAKIEADKLYLPLSAMKVVKDTNVTKYDASVEVSMVLGVDPKKADQAVRSVWQVNGGANCLVRFLWIDAKHHGNFNGCVVLSDVSFSNDLHRR